MNSDYQMQAAGPLDGAMHADCDGGGLIADIPAEFTHGMPPDTGAQAGTDGFQASTSIADEGTDPCQADALHPEESSQDSTATVFDRRISMCSRTSDTTVGSLLVYEALAQIGSGTYRSEIEEIRRILLENGSSKDSIQEAKRSLPAYLWSGEFVERNDKGLKQHSGLMCLDIDDLTPEEVHTAQDPDRSGPLHPGLFRFGER